MAGFITLFLIFLLFTAENTNSFNKIASSRAKYSTLNLFTSMRPHITRGWALYFGEVLHILFTNW